MYNKLFSKIIRSSVWLQSHTTRIVWLTLLATMDEDGFCDFASIGNVAITAIVTLEEATIAIKVLESPDLDSSDPDNDGRRIERVPGGWIVRNAKKYRDLATREMVKISGRKRMQKFRERHAQETVSNDSVTDGDGLVSLSDTDTDTEKEKQVPVDSVFDFPLIDGSEYSVPQKLYGEYVKSYPAISVMEEFGKMRAWLISNPRNKKTRTGITRFMSSWLNRAQDRARPNSFTENNSAPPKPRSAKDVLREQGIIV